MLLDGPTIVVIVMFGIVLLTTIIIYIYRNEMFIIRTYIWHNVLYYLPNNRINIDTGTADCTVVDENEEFYDIINDEYKHSNEQETIVNIV